MADALESPSAQQVRNEFFARVAQQLLLYGVFLPRLDFYAPARRIRDALAEQPFLNCPERLQELFKDVLPPLFNDFRNLTHAVNSGSYHDIEKERAADDSLLALWDWLYLAARSLPFKMRTAMGGIAWALMPHVCFCFLTWFFLFKKKKTALLFFFLARLQDS